MQHKKWHPTNPNEMKGFLAIIFNMGLVNLPQIEDYWKRSWLIEVPFFASSQLRMSSGEVSAYRADHLLALAWLAERKKKPVIMISTSSSAAVTTLTSRNHHVPPQVKPVVDSYNHHMNGVDIADQYAV